MNGSLALDFNPILVKHLAAPVWHLQPFPCFEQSGTLAWLRPGDPPAPCVLKDWEGPQSSSQRPQHDPSWWLCCPLSHPSPLQPVVWGPWCWHVGFLVVNLGICRNLDSIHPIEPEFLQPVKCSPAHKAFMGLPHNHWLLSDKASADRLQSCLGASRSTVSGRRSEHCLSWSLLGDWLLTKGPGPAGSFGVPSSAPS